MSDIKSLDALVFQEVIKDARETAKTASACGMPVDLVKACISTAEAKLEWSNTTLKVFRKSTKLGFNAGTVLNLGLFFWFVPALLPVSIAYMGPHLWVLALLCLARYVFVGILHVFEMKRNKAIKDFIFMLKNGSMSASNKTLFG
jgi:hypothetical protein